MAHQRTAGRTRQGITSVNLGTVDDLTEVKRRLAEAGVGMSAFVRQALRDAGYLPAPEERRDPAA